MYNFGAFTLGWSCKLLFLKNFLLIQIISFYGTKYINRLSKLFSLFNKKARTSIAHEYFFYRESKRGKRSGFGNWSDV